MITKEKRHQSKKLVLAMFDLCEGQHADVVIMAVLNLVIAILPAEERVDYVKALIAGFEIKDEQDASLFN
jgi:hypothetical protein